MCSGQCPSATSCWFRFVFVFLEWHVHLITRNEVCQVFWREATLRVPKLLPSPCYAIRHIPFVTCIPQGIMGNSTVHTIIATYWQSLVTCMQFAEVTFPRHPQSYCQRSYGMHDCLKARQPRGQIIKFMWWGEENDFKNMDLLLV